MEQQLGLALIERFQHETYINILPNDLRNLLYKYLYEASYEVYVTPNELIHPASRIFEREIILSIFINGIKILCSFDINYIRNREPNAITFFINNSIGKFPAKRNLKINKYVELIYTAHMTNIKIDVITTEREGYKNPLIGYMKIFSQIQVPITTDLLTGLKMIATTENL